MAWTEAEFLNDLAVESSNETGRVPQKLETELHTSFNVKKGILVNNVYTIDFDNEKSWWNNFEAMEERTHNAENLLEKLWSIASFYR